MNTKCQNYSYVQTDNNEARWINLTACSDNHTEIYAWGSGYALRKAAKELVSDLKTP